MIDALLIYKVCYPSRAFQRLMLSFQRPMLSFQKHSILPETVSYFQKQYYISRNGRNSRDVSLPSDFFWDPADPPRIRVHWSRNLVPYSKFGNPKVQKGLDPDHVTVAFPKLPIPETLPELAELCLISSKGRILKFRSNDNLTQNYLGFPRSGFQNSNLKRTGPGILLLLPRLRFQIIVLERLEPELCY